MSLGSYRGRNHRSYKNAETIAKMQEGRMAIGAKNCLARFNDILKCLCNLVTVHSW